MTPEEWERGRREATELEALEERLKSTYRARSALYWTSSTRYKRRMRRFYAPCRRQTGAGTPDANEGGAM